MEDLVISNPVNRVIRSGHPRYRIVLRAMLACTSDLDTQCWHLLEPQVCK